MSELHLAWATAGVRWSLRESMRTLAENALEHGYLPGLLLTCDSESPSERERATAALESNAKALCLHGDISGRGERFGFLESSPPNFDEDVLEHALLGDSELRHLGLVGTNRNATLLATAGELAIMSDDDIYARPGRIRQETHSEPQYSSSAFPGQVLTFPDRNSLLEAVQPVTLDIVGAHLALLGCSFSENVVVTTTGSYGDAGTGSARSFLVLDDERRWAYYADQETYEKLKLSRETVRIPDRTYFGPGRHLMAMNIGVDNNDVRPPFFPVGRGSDTLFSLLARILHPGSLTGFLDFGLLHQPDERRVNSLEELVQMRPSVADLVTALLITLVPDKDMAEPETRYQVLGRRLVNLASSPLSDLALFVHAGWSKAVVKYVEHLEGLIDRYNGEPEYWRRDVELHLDRLREALREPTSIFGEKGCGLSPEKFAEQTKLFGRLLMCWPELWEWARGDPERRRGLVSPVT